MTNYTPKQQAWLDKHGKAFAESVAKEEKRREAERTRRTIKQQEEYRRNNPNSFVNEREFWVAVDSGQGAKTYRTDGGHEIVKKDGQYKIEHSWETWDSAGQNTKYCNTKDETKTYLSELYYNSEDYSDAYQGGDDFWKYYTWA